MRRSRSRQEAAGWFARLGRRAVTTASLREFRTWKARPENAQAYADVERSWEGAGMLGRDPEIVARTSALLARRSPRDTAASHFFQPAATLALGLACVVVIVAASLALMGRDVVYETKTGERSVVRLQDGSTLSLNTASKVSVRFADKVRRVSLDRGEAFFDVAHDAQRPFIVAAGGAAVRAIGTRFDVRRDAGQTRVTLVQGVVGVSQGGRSWTLHPNQQLRLEAATPAAPQALDAASATSWTGGRLTFHETPLGEAVAEVNRYSETKIELGAPGYGAVRVNGVFDAGDTASFVSAVTALFPLKARTAPGGGILLTGSGPPAPQGS
ncbi:FecR family protein [Phenylobacterium sp.]|uniref:FecR family protein n=1 Tax=Phenylobacterium sp. TaxID=1871053 RepID=UPI002DE781FC|nr:FecR domain-containing protein [Phenylobacterium sp.]